MSSEGTVLPRILGTAFARLDASVQRLHRAGTMEFRGSAKVERGEGWLPSLVCHLAGLPRNVTGGPLRFTVETEGESEIWTRHFGGSGPMTSRVQYHRGLLRERLGPALLDFELSEAQGVLHWRAAKLRVFGIPVPRRLFDFNAQVRGQGEEYHFAITARLALVGTLIRYEGVLHVH
jgi:hypothetical protein